MQKNANETKKPCNIPEALSPFENSENTAVICGSEKMSYKELIAEAKNVAQALIARGINKGDRVVIDMSRSINFLRIFLGVIYAGGVEVTIHNGWPEQQRAHVIKDCSPSLIVDDKNAYELLSANLSPEDSARPLPFLNGDDSFQIVYTSGSTGIPKGAVKSHQIPIDNYVENEVFGKGDPMLCYYVKNCQCMLLDANLAFAVATLQIFFALMNGKSLAFATDEELKTSKGLADCIKNTNADVIFGVPSRYYQFMEDPEFANVLKRLKMIALTGELPSNKMLDAFFDISDAALYYPYGNSETCSIYSDQYKKGSKILFSPPFNGNPVYILDDKYVKQVPSGTIGELCIGGFSAQQGHYWNDAELTAKKYINHSEYGRIFLTGDRARLESDGSFNILGRLDGMTKLHGQRIELGAIEKCMENFPGIRRAAVKIQGEGSKAVLCGYYTGTVNESALRRTLAESLPYYMVPTLLRELPKFPLNLNGKTDKKALPLIQSKTVEYVPAKTQTEKLLCEIFANVLKLQKPVGIDDSFFELGGDSIRGMATSALLREQGFEMKMEWLFAVPTVRALAPMLQPLKTEEDTDETLWSSELTEKEKEKINATVGLENIESIYPLFNEAKIFAQNKDPYWLFETYLVNGEFTVDELRQRLANSVRCHQAMRSLIVMQDTVKPLQVVLKNWEIPIFTVDLSSMAVTDESIEKLSDAQSRYLNNLRQLYEIKPFTSSKVMFEAGLIKISNNRSILVFAYSHLLLDGIGKSKVLSELLGEYATISDVLQYNRYMRHILSDSYRKDSLAIWRKALVDHSSLTEIPTSTGNEIGRCIKSFVAGKQFTEKAFRFCQNMHITISALSCLALGKVLMDLNRKNEAGFLSVTSGRDLKNPDLTGMFSMGIPVFIREEDTPATVQEQIVCAMNRPLPDLDELGLERQGSRNLIFLSVQNYAKPQISKKFELLPNSDLASKSIVAKQPPKISRPLSIFIFTEQIFYFLVIYDGQLVNADFAQKLGRKLLTQLRCLVEL